MCRQHLIADTTGLRLARTRHQRRISVRPVVLSLQHHQPDIVVFITVPAPVSVQDTLLRRQDGDAPPLMLVCDPRATQARTVAKLTPVVSANFA